MALREIRVQGDPVLNKMCKPIITQIKKRVGNFVYGIDSGSLENLVVKLLNEQNKTIATAESCTGGLLAKRITDISGSSAVFETGCVTYANKTKEKLTITTNFCKIM